MTNNSNESRFSEVPVEDELQSAEQSTAVGILENQHVDVPSDSMSFKRAFQDISQGFQQRQLWLTLGLQDIKQRYRRSVLGPFWITIATGVMAIALGLLYSMLFNQDLRTFLPHVTVGLIVWGFISGSIREGSEVFIANEGLIKQLPAPYSVHVYRLVWRQLLILMHNLVIWAVMMFIFRPDLGWAVLLAIPGIALLVINGLWCSMLFGILATRFRDVGPLLDSLVQLAFYMTPIVWTTKTLIEQGGDIAKRARLAELNPLYHYLEIVRAPLIGEPIEAYHWGIVGIFTVLGLLAMILVMRKWRFRISYWV